MDANEVLEALTDILRPNRLTPLDCLVFRQSWLGQTYQEMAKESGYDSDYIKEIGFRLWNDLSDALGTRVTKKNLRLVFSRLQSHLPHSIQPIQPSEFQPKKSSDLQQQGICNGMEDAFSSHSSHSLSLANLTAFAPYPEAIASSRSALSQRPDSLDYLTQLTNQRYFNEYLEVHWQRWVKLAVPVSLILCEVDHFPFYQHIEEYLIGDAWLQQIGKAIGSCVHHYAEVVSRYGGTTFAALVPRMDTVILSEVAENLRESVKSLTIQHNPVHTRPLPNLAITLSIGVASLAPAPSLDPDALIAVAQAALAESKQRGGDRVTMGSTQLVMETISNPSQ